MVGYDPDPRVFYLLEARKKEGWDKFLPGRGMLITKISYNASDWANNTVNNSATRMGVDIMEAKANNTTGQNARAKSTDAYPAGAKFWTGLANHEVTEISIHSCGAVIFSYRNAELSGVEEVQEEKAVGHKMIKDGQIVIMRGDKTYDLLGRTLDR